MRLHKMPASITSLETRTRRNLCHVTDVPYPLNPSKSPETQYLNPLIMPIEQQSYHVSHNQCYKPSILQVLTTSWFQEQSELMCTMWLQPSRSTTIRTQDLTKTASLHAFYRESTRATRMMIHPQNNKHK